MSAYSVLKLVHFVAAIVAVGANVSYFVWFNGARTAPQAEQVFALRGIKTLDAWLANPAYVVRASGPPPWRGSRCSARRRPTASTGRTG